MDKRQRSTVIVSRSVMESCRFSPLESEFTSWIKTSYKTSESDFCRFRSV